MCSRIQPRCCLLIALVSLTIVMCAREGTSRDPAFDVQLQQKSDCLTEFGDNISNYFKGRLTRGEVVEFWDCTAKSIKEFQRLTAGENGGPNYTPQALRRFVFKHFYKKRQLSDDLLNSAMELKRVLLSGTNRAVTREELSLLQDFLTEMKVVTLELHPHVKVLFGSNTTPASDAEVEQAARAFQRATQRLGTWFDRFQQPYTFEHMRILLVSLKDWMKDNPQSLDVLDKMERALPALSSAKTILLSGRPELVEGHRWIELMRLVDRAFHIYLEFRHGFDEHLNAGLIRNSMPEAIHVFADLLDEGVAARGGPGIPFAEWQTLFERIEQSKLMSSEFTAAALRPAFDWLVIRTLGGGTPSEEVTAAHVRNLRRQAGIWKNILARVNGESYVDVPEWRQFEAILNGSAPLGWDKEGRLEHKRQGPTTWTQDNRRRMVWPFVILNWIRESYVGPANQMTEDQMMAAVAEILPMLQNFGWMTTTKLSIGKRLVREADLFMEISNGDSFLQLGEAVHYLGFVASGFRVAQLWLEEADQKCGGREAVCVRNLATKADSVALVAMPHLRQAVLSEPPEKFAKYMRAAEETVLGKVVSGPMGTKDVLQVLQLVQYVEVFLKLYDRSNQETIDLAESMVAYQKYGPTLSRLLSRNGFPPEEVLAFYTFMMKYGDTPFAMLGGGVVFLNWKIKRNDWAFEADRFVLMSILNQLSKL